MRYELLWDGIPLFKDGFMQLADVGGLLCVSVNAPFEFIPQWCAIGQCMRHVWRHSDPFLRSDVVLGHGLLCKPCRVWPSVILLQNSVILGKVFLHGQYHNISKHFTYTYAFTLRSNTTSRVSLLHVISPKCKCCTVKLSLSVPLASTTPYTLVSISSANVHSCLIRKHNTRLHRCWVNVMCIRAQRKHSCLCCYKSREAFIGLWHHILADWSLLLTVWGCMRHLVA